MSQVKLEDIVSLAKRRGFVFQASEIYGGLAGFYDYGPLGVELVNNLKQEWWKAMVREHDNIFGVDSAIIQNPKLWEASGHVGGFTDPLVEDTVTHKRYRADHLAGVDSNDLKELTKLLKDKKSPDGNPLSEPRVFNMMMKTYVGPVEDSESTAYLRPETAGPMFTNYENVRETMRAKLPFGVAQIGKAFRNEISPRDFIFRVRELEQMEMQYFIRPAEQEKTYEEWRDFAWKFLTERLGIDEKNLEWHEHDAKERAHYAAAAHDIYFKFPQGFKELWGTHNRTDYDLGAHQKASGKDLQYFDDQSQERFTPYVIESSVGVGRMLMAVLTDAYHEEEINGETRVVLKLKPDLAPYRVAVSPLLKNKPELAKKAREVYDALKKEFGNVMWDDNGNIGKRYRRQDEIGTPYCVVIDFGTLEDDTVTVRDRDTTKQTRVAIANLPSKLN
ncbi:glycine--tRNA ligase [Candidatus Saccharibacteria bacterium CG_4_10_14_0_2_um_filter_52_9]|nr:MAG: glycine--tRNA ligase [Candidatus Saccharibacteria bacterium CG_4_10_14_0_2_um_filter_52_9]